MGFSRAPDPGLTKRDRLIPRYFVACFAVVIAVNGVMVYFALSTMPGLSTERAYETGLRYNETLKKDADAKALGWQFVIDPCSKPQCAFSLQVVDSGQKPLANVPVLFEAVRQTRAGLDFKRSTKTDAAGRVQLNLNFPAIGEWQIFITATNPNGVQVTRQYEWRLEN